MGDENDQRFWVGEDPSVEFLAAIIEHVGHPIFVKNPRSEWVLLNRAFCEMVGHPREAMLGKTDHDFFPEAEADFFRRKDLELFDQGSTVVVEEEPLTDGAGHKHVLSTTKVPYRDASGEVTHLVGIISDITRIKEAEDALRDANQELERRVAERSTALAAAHGELLRKERLAVLGQLAGGMAHQLRNPLGAIQNAIALVLHETLGKKQLDAVRVIQEEVARADHIITALLDYARIAPPARRRVPVVDLLAEVIDLEGLPDSITVEVQLDPELEVDVDVTQVQMALGNLVRNAREAMPEGGRIEWHGHDTGKAVELSVQDTGPGVPESRRDLLFEPLITSKAEGSGLGLCTARNLIENQGGRLDFCATGGGARFVMQLPR